MEFDFDGIEELRDSLVKAMKSYGDIAEEELDLVSKEFKKSVIKHTRESVNIYSGKLIRGYRLDKIEGKNENLSRDFRGTAPHFHLIENGHEQKTKDGRTVGWVAGRLIVHQTRNEYESIMPKRVLRVLERVIEKGGLND